MRRMAGGRSIGLSRRSLAALVGGGVLLLVVGGLVGAVIALAADGGRAEAPNARPTASPTVAADDPAIRLALADGHDESAPAYKQALADAATGCGASQQWTADRVERVVDVGRDTSIWAMLVALRDKRPGGNCPAITTQWYLGYLLPSPAAP